MWEKGTAWAVATCEGAQTIHKLELSEKLGHLIDGTVRGLGIQQRCNGCNLPGGGLNKVAISRDFPASTDPDEPTEYAQPFPEGESVACKQTLTERGRCPSIQANLQQMLHDAKLCDPLNCETCRKRSGAAIKAGQLIAVRGMTTQNVPGGGQAMVFVRWLGKFIGRDKLGACFEGYNVEKGPTGLRFWLTDAGHFCEDLLPSDQKQIESKQRNKPSGIITPDSPQFGA